MASYNFPNIRPASRTFTPGAPATREFVAMNGAVTLVNYGKLLFDDTLNFGYIGLDWDVAMDFRTNYQKVMTGGGSVGFFKGHKAFADIAANTDGNDGTAWINDGASGVWRYAEPPTFDAQITSIVNVQVQLVRRLITA